MVVSFWVPIRLLKTTNATALGLGFVCLFVFGLLQQVAVACPFDLGEFISLI